MSSHITRIEIFEDEFGGWSYGSSELDLMGYRDIFNLMYDIREKLKNGN